MGNGCSALSVGFHTLPQTTPYWPDRAVRPSDRKITLGWVGVSIVVILLNEAIIAAGDQMSVWALAFWLAWAAASSAMTLARWAVVRQVLGYNLEEAEDF